MVIEIGQVEAIFRYPVKSMAGEQLEAANLGWHGLDGDRRLALRRMENRSGMPWLTASKLPRAGWRKAACLRRGVGRGGRTPVRGFRANFGSPHQKTENGPLGT
jgi:hypothetical protein